jgi:anthranilate/para-aminobenzoate synthase component II
MALEHRELPVYGVQFHPESVLSPFGLQLLKNFIEIVDKRA